MLTEVQREKLRDETAELLLAMRAAYLRTPSASPLKNWDLLTSRFRAAARTSASVEHLVTDMARGLRLGAPSSDYSAAVQTLADHVRELGAAREYLQLCDEEWSYLVALAHNIADARKRAAPPAAPASDTDTTTGTTTGG